MNRPAPLASLLLLPLAAAAAPIEQIWLTHATPDPSRIVVSWQTDAPSDSTVEYGPTASLGERASREERVTLHHVEIPMGRPGAPLHYRVRSGADTSPAATCKGYPGGELRVAVVGDWGFARAKDLGALRRDDPHLLLTAGDNVPNLHADGFAGTRAFASLIGAHRELFRTTPFLPALGNHDREIAPRGPRPPARPVYDVEASVYREFFALPGDEWRWHFDIPHFDVRFVALDLNHIQDHGTTWQTCHAWQPDSDQFAWYARVMAETRRGFVFTLMNEKRTQLDSLAKGAWNEHFRKGNGLITGFGYFAERAELDGDLPCFNTCLKGDGDVYRDPRSRFLASEDNYLLLTFVARAPSMRVQIKSLRGGVLDTREIPRRAR